MSQLTFDVIHWLDFDSSLLTGVNQTFLTLRLTWTFWLTSWLTKDFSQLAWGLALRDLVWTIRIDLWRALLSSVGSARPMWWGSAADQGLTPGLGPLLLVTPPLSPCFLSHSSAVLSIKPKKYLKKKKNWPGFQLFWLSVLTWTCRTAVTADMWPESQWRHSEPSSWIFTEADWLQFLIFHHS